ncbi:MAG: nucleotide exchange factor GrpE [Pseudomonadota bacterium]
MSDTPYPPNDGQNDQNANDAGADDDTLTDEAIASAIAEQNDGGAAADGANAEEIEKLKDQMLRLAAELENTRRRAERDKVDVARYAITEFARDLLGVADNFTRALDAADGAADDPATALTSLIDGLRMTEKSLLSAFERHGLKRIDPKGEKFDPNLHQAVAHAPGGVIPAGHVVDVAQPGFMIKDRVLRAAMVMVSSGESSAPGAAETPPTAGDGAPGGRFDTKA